MRAPMIVAEAACHVQAEDPDLSIGTPHYDHFGSNQSEVAIWPSEMSDVAVN
jgi:hypothetical protein